MTTTPIRRPYLLRPGEGPILALPVVGEDKIAVPGINILIERAGTVGEDFGLDDPEILVNPIVSIPLPLRQLDPRTVPWHMLWHPFVWMPDRMARPYLFVNEEGQEREEAMDEHALRVALELAGTGLYDRESGTWLDVLSLVGLRIEEPAVQERIRLWQAGGADEDLDSINLAALLDAGEDAAWGKILAAELFEHVIGASWHVTARDLAGLIGHAVTMEDPNGVVWSAAAAREFIGDAAVAGTGSLKRELDDLIPRLVEADMDMFTTRQDLVEKLVETLLAVSREYVIHFDGMVKAGESGDDLPPFAAVKG